MLAEEVFLEHELSMSRHETCASRQQGPLRKSYSLCYRADGMLTTTSTKKHTRTVFGLEDAAGHERLEHQFARLDLPHAPTRGWRRPESVLPHEVFAPRLTSLCAAGHRG